MHGFINLHFVCFWAYVHFSKNPTHSFINETPGLDQYFTGEAIKELVKYIEVRERTHSNTHAHARQV